LVNSQQKQNLQQQTDIGQSLISSSINLTQMAVPILSGSLQNNSGGNISGSSINFGARGVVNSQQQQHPNSMRTLYVFINFILKNNILLFLTHTINTYTNLVNFHLYSKLQHKYIPTYGYTPTYRGPNLPPIFFFVNQLPRFLPT